MRKPPQSVGSGNPRGWRASPEIWALRGDVRLGMSIAGPARVPVLSMRDRPVSSFRGSPIVRTTGRGGWPSGFWRRPERKNQLRGQPSGTPSAREEGVAPRPDFKGGWLGPGRGSYIGPRPGALFPPLREQAFLLACPGGGISNTPSHGLRRIGGIGRRRGFKIPRP